MNLRKKILSFLLEALNSDENPWMTADELRYLLNEAGIRVEKEEIASEIERLSTENYVDVISVSPTSLARGFITKMTIPGRNMWVHGVESLTGT